MIAPPKAHGKWFLRGVQWPKNAQKSRTDDHELVKGSHNNAQFRSTAGHAAL